MPAPVVYVLAIAGTVGAVLAFKEFVYEPHIAPAFDRWKQEYQAAREARRRRRAMEVSQDGSELLMSETRRKFRASDKHSDEDDSDEDEDHGKSSATTGTSHSFMRDGLLIRRSTLSAMDNNDVELENLGAHELNPWRNEVPGQVLRQRRNVSEHAMDESIQQIPYTPITPSVVFDASAQLPSPPSSDAQLSPPGMIHTGALISSESETPEESATLPANFPARVAEHNSSLHSSVSSLATPSPDVTISTQSNALEASESSVNIPTNSYHQTIPSLSQSYPQDLDYEHDLELLSPPSSRADSPFSLAALSPEQGVNRRPLSALSSVLSSPSPLGMGLGNHSYDAISPVPQIQPITPNENASATNSGRSSTYLSFTEDGSDATLITRAGGEGASPASLNYNRSASYAYNNLPVQPEGLGLFPIAPREPRTPIAASPSGFTPNASVNVTAGASDPSYFRASATPSASASPSVTASSYLAAYQGSTDNILASGAHATGIQSDSELSDLDFMSDYQASEISEVSDLGEVSDESWSVAGGSEAGMSPRVGPVVGHGRAAEGGRMWRA